MGLVMLAPLVAAALVALARPLVKLVTLVYEQPMRLQDYLAKKELSTRDFGKLVGVSYAAISRYCNGQRFPHPKVLRAILSETNGRVTPNDFLDGPQR